MKYLILIFLFSACASKKLSSNEKKAKLFYSQGITLLGQDKYTDALNNLVKADRLTPNKDNILSALGLAFHFRGASDKAISHLARAIKLNPNKTEYKNNLATIYMESGKLDLAKKYYQIAVKDLAYEKSFLAYYNLGILEEKRNNSLLAYEYFKKSTQEKPYCWSYFKLGQYSLSAGKHAQAADELKKATQGTCHQNPSGHLALAQAYLRLGNKQLAKIKLTEVIQSFPASAEAKQALKLMANF